MARETASREVGCSAHGPRRTGIGFPPTAEESFVEKWKPDIERAARRAGRALRGGAVDADDLAQDATIRIISSERSAAGRSEGYNRRLIANTVKGSVRRERRAFGTGSRRCVPMPLDRRTPATDATDEDSVSQVRTWVGTLPARLRDTYCLLFEEQLPQHDAARLLATSQPRVSQLRRVLLERGERDLKNCC